MGLVVVRTNHTYIQRMPKELSKKRKFDFYYPVFQALGEQAVETPSESGDVVAPSGEIVE